jgi:tetratricopeptide (TPR) repeat protein
VLEHSQDPREKAAVLRQLAEMYYLRGLYAKAISAMEQAMFHTPGANGDPEWLFRLGEFYRDAGLGDKSAETFFRVLNSIVIGGEKNLKRYLRIARLAKFEIARIRYMEENYELAFSLFNRIELLELSEVDRETVMYYQVLSATKALRSESALTVIEDFIRQFPTSEFVPEIIYIKADVLMGLGQVAAGSAALMQLLDSVGDREDQGTSEWVFWRQQAGNRLANRFYAEGDYLVALRIYQGMVGLSESPSWRMPVVYQIGLCFEKLKMSDRAKESYAYLVQHLEKLDAARMTPALRQLSENVNWRMKLLDWRNDAEEQALDLLNNNAST